MSHAYPACIPPSFNRQRQRAKKRIVLPEGDEPRTMRAATICEQRGIAHCILLGDPERIGEQATRHGITLPDSITIINPVDVVERYIEPLVELRGHKGVTEAVARDKLIDTVMLGTLMLKLDEVDGLVSGAVHTTANTIRQPYS